MRSLSGPVLSLAQLVPGRLRPRLARIPLVADILTRMLAPAAVRRVRIRRGALAGVVLELDVAHEKSFWAGTHEPDTQRVMTYLARPGTCVWDVGAHIGFFTLLVARRGCHVVAVEPDPTNAARLRRHVELNHADVDVVEAAVAGEPGVAALEPGPTTGTARLAGVTGPRWRDVATGRAVEVRATTLDALLEPHRTPDVIKLDVEGAELEVLRAGGRALAAASAVVCEAHSRELRAAVADELRARGFDVELVGDDHVLGLRS